MSDVYGWILAGQSEHDIIEAIADRWPGTDPKPLIIAAVERFHAAGQFQPEIMLGWCAEAYREIYRVSMAAGDCAAALRAVKMLQQLAGVA